MKAVLWFGTVAVLGWGQSREVRVAELTAAMRERLVECRRDLHMHPELSNEEVRTGKMISERLRVLGYTEIKTNVAGNGVVAVLRGGKPGPVVAWRADMDALPIDESAMTMPYKSTVKGVKHACGHDAHVAIGLGMAEVMMKMRDEVPGTVKFIFQPAEEKAQKVPSWGAKLMIEEGAMRDPAPEAIFAFHMGMLPVGTLGWADNAASAASDDIHIAITGKRAHGAYPYQGIDAIAVASQCIVALQTIHSRRIDTRDPSVLTLGTIHGGDRRNIIAESIEMTGTVRTYSDKNQGLYEGLMRQTLDGCTSAMGATYKLTYTKGYPSMLNNPALARKVLPAIERVVGAGKVQLREPGMTGEDFSYFQRVVPGVMFTLGGGNAAKGITAGNHTAEFDIDEESLPIGVKAGVGILFEYLDKGGKH